MIIGISLASGESLDRISFFTLLPDGTYKSYGPYGPYGGTPVTVVGKVVGFFGRSGQYLDALGFYVDN